MDWDTCLRLDSSGACFAHIAYPVAGYRVNEGQITAQPRELIASNRQAVRSGYGSPGRRLKEPPRFLDAAYKLVSGGNPRQISAPRMRGLDMKWMRADVGPEGVFDLIRLCYAVDLAS
jgi:hypothetical protein